MKKRSLAAGLALALSLSLTPLQAANTTYLDGTPPPSPSASSTC